MSRSLNRPSKYVKLTTILGYPIRSIDISNVKSRSELDFLQSGLLYHIDDWTKAKESISSAKEVISFVHYSKTNEKKRIGNVLFQHNLYTLITFTCNGVKQCESCERVLPTSSHESHC